MELEVKQMPYVLRKAPFSGRRYARRECIDRKRFFFMGKRCIDIIFSLFVLLTFLSWVIPALALLIKLDSRGPVFFLQRRTGKGGRIFLCYKLRTMIVNKDADSRQAGKNDIRITGLGEILRKFNLDELPQFFNVLQGTMSLVGPRPHMMADCNHFSALVPGYKIRNFVRPGITGLAQVKGFHGPALDRLSIDGRYQWDQYYIHHAGVLLDINILCRTMISLFYKR
ncbi:sugar transferase [Flavitalea flava]